MTPLRRAMIDAMTLRGFSRRTHQSYLSAVTDLSRHYRRSPDRLSVDEIQAYFLYLAKERRLSGASCQLYLNAVKFLYREVLKWPAQELAVQVPKKPQRIPELLTRTEVSRIVRATENLKHRMLLGTCYGCGLRAAGERAGGPEGQSRGRRAAPVAGGTRQGGQGPPRDSG